MAGTSRRPNVVTSQRRNVESTYKEVSTSFSSQSLKGKWERNSRGSEIGNRTNQGAEIRAALTSTLEKSPRFVLSLFWILELMFYISPIGIFLFIMF